MRRAAGLVALGLALALAPTAAAGSRPVSAAASFAPLVHRFGDTVTATVLVAVETRRANPASVAISVSFAPYRVVAVQHRRATGLDGVVLLRDAFVLRCTSASCVPRAPERALALRPARITWRTRAGGHGRLDLRWPPLVVASRLTRTDLVQPALRAQIAPPLSRHGLSARTVGAALLAGGGVLVAAGAATAILLLRPRRRALPQGPLAHALDLVERAALGDVVERRRALYRLALELERQAPDPGAWAARRLAWASAPPDPDAMRELAVGVRSRPETR